MWKCPECGSKDLRVFDKVVATLSQGDDGSFETEGVGHHEWDEYSTMLCNACDYEAESASFEYDEESDHEA